MREEFIYFKEILTGVQNDSNAKAIRMLCFLVLFAGTIWSGLSYYNAIRFSDTSIEIGTPRSFETNSRELDRVVSLARQVTNMKVNGERLANNMTNMNRRLFNTDGLNIPGLETEEQSFVPGLESEEEVQEEVRPEVNVKAVMLAGSSGFAVVSVGSRRENQGLIVRRGYELPEEAGRVIRIKSDGITVRIKGEEINYMIK